MASVNKPVRSPFLERSKIARQRMAWRFPLSITPSKALNGAAIDEVVVELKPKTRQVRHGNATVGVDPGFFDEHLAQGGCGPPRGFVRELEPRGVGDGGDQVQVGQQAYAMSPGMRRDQAARRLRQGGYLPHLV